MRYGHFTACFSVGGDHVFPTDLAHLLFKCVFMLIESESKKVAVAVLFF